MREASNSLAILLAPAPSAAYGTIRSIQGRAHTHTHAYTLSLSGSLFYSDFSFSFLSSSGGLGDEP